MTEKLLKMVKNGRQRLEMAGNGSKCLKINGNCWKWNEQAGNDHNNTTNAWKLLKRADTG